MTTNPLEWRKFRSKSSDSSEDKLVKKRVKLKKSQTTIDAFDYDVNLPLRRRFSLFRAKRVNMHELQQTIEQLRADLDMKTSELETMKTNQSLEQAMKIQTILNQKLEEILEENQTLTQRLEEFVRTDKRQILFEDIRRSFSTIKACCCLN